VENLPSAEALHFLLVRKERISLMKLVENYISDNSFCGPESQVVLKAFSMLKNTAAIDILLKFSVT
jgi:hypothetical protein